MNVLTGPWISYHCIAIGCKRVTGQSESIGHKICQLGMSTFN